MDQAKPVAGVHSEGVEESLEVDSSRRWTKCANAPLKARPGSVLVDGSTVYFYLDYDNGGAPVCTYDIPTQVWSFLPMCGNRRRFSIALVNGMVTAIGGSEQRYEGMVFFNTLLSLTGVGEGRKWVELLPPMPTKRSHTAVLHTGKSLIVAGGHQGSPAQLNAVEVLDTETLQWSIVSSLPAAIHRGFAVLHGDDVYVLAGGGFTRFAAKCSLADLLESTPQSPSPWRDVAQLPIEHCTTTVMGGRLLAIGGYGYTGPTDNIYQYFPTTNTWEVISHLPSARCFCLVVVLPGNKLMVVGGAVRTPYDLIDLVEIGTLY